MPCLPAAFIPPRRECTLTRFRWRSVSDDHPSSSLIPATEAHISHENTGRTEMFAVGLSVIRAQSDGSVHSPAPRR